MHVCYSVYALVQRGKDDFANATVRICRSGGNDRDTATDTETANAADGAYENVKQR